jgi:hypothetical protein
MATSSPCSECPGDEDLRAHEVDAGDHLGHGVLDLDARVHLDEEPLVPVHVVEELDGAGVVVADALGERTAASQSSLRTFGSSPPRARPRSTFWCGAAPSNRARGGGRRCRAGRRGSAPRCAWRAGCSARGRPPGCRRRSASFWASAEQAGESEGFSTTRMPRPAAAEGRLDDEREADLVRDVSASSGR